MSSVTGWIPNLPLGTTLPAFKLSIYTLPFWLRLIPSKAIYGLTLGSMEFSPAAGEDTTKSSKATTKIELGIKLHGGGMLVWSNLVRRRGARLKFHTVDAKLDAIYQDIGRRSGAVLHSRVYDADGGGTRHVP